MSEDGLEIVLMPGPWEGEAYTDCWPVGGRISGLLRACFGDRVKTRRVTVALDWHTEGRGDRDEESVSQVEVHEGDLAAGQRYEWPFELAVPDDGPISYNGHLIEIAWAVRARIDIPWGRDKKTEHPIQILADYDLA